MRWYVCAVLVAALVVGVSAAPEATVSCPDKYYESVSENTQGSAWLRNSAAVGSLFNIVKGTGKLSISMWLKITIGGTGIVPILDIVGRPTVNGQVVDGDGIQLGWNSDTSEMQLSVLVGDNRTTVDGPGIIPLASDRYRNVLLTVDASTGRITVSVDSVEVIREQFTSVRDGGLAFSPAASLGYGISVTGGTSTSFENMTLGDLTVFSGEVIGKREAEYLSQFRMPMKENAGKCVVDTSVDDPGAPVGNGNVHTFFFYKSINAAGFSFEGALMFNSSSSIVESPLQLKARTAAGTISLSSTNWTPAQQQSHTCGSVQTATMTYTASSTLVMSFAMKLVYSTEPPSGTVFTLTNADSGDVLASFTSPLLLDTLSFHYYGTSLKFKLQASGDFSTFCVDKVTGYEMGSVIADPHVVYHEQESGIALYTGVRDGDMGALLPANESCFSPSATYASLDHVRTSSSGDGYFVFNVKNAPPGMYVLCLYPRGAPGQKHVAAQSAGGCATHTFLCTILLAETPSNAIPLPTGWIRSLLHLGEGYNVSLPIKNIEEDPFYSTGGESHQEPDFGDSLYFDGKRYLWSPLEVEDGRFAKTGPANTMFWIQYFAIAIYSPTTQSAVITIRLNTTTRVYFDGDMVLDSWTIFPLIDHSSPLNITKGWHQVIIKVTFPALFRGTSEMSIRFDNAVGLSWNYVKPSGDVTNCETGNRTVSCFGNADVVVSHQECVEAGCCYSETNQVKCFLPGKPRPYRPDGLCGPGVPTDASDLEFAECNWHSCCSNGHCAQGYAECACPTCVDYNYVPKPRSKFILWGTRAACSGSRNVHVGSFSKEICQLQCDRDDGCVGFSVGTPDKTGVASCHLSYGTCTQTVEDPAAKETYLRLSSNCGMTASVQGGCSNSSGKLTTYGANIGSDSCFRGCSMTSECAVAIYNTQSKTCTFSSTSCTSVSDEHSITSRFQCSGDDAQPPTPLPALPLVPNSTLLGCYKDPAKEYFAQPEYPQYPENLYTDNYIVIADKNKTACSEHCLKVGTLYFALTDGTVCTCGVYNNESLYEDDQKSCNIPCLEGSDMCGGASSASVYRINSYVGLCQHGYSYFEGHCYKVVKEKSTWLESREYCEGEAAMLVGTFNANLNQYLISLAEGDPLWIGVHRMQFEQGGLFYSTSLFFNFSDWLPQEPNGHFSDRTEDCVLVKPSHPTPYDGSWMNEDCDAKYAFACVMDPTNGSPNIQLYTGITFAAPAWYCLPSKQYEDITGQHLVGHYLLHQGEFVGTTFHDKSGMANDIKLQGITSPGWVDGIKDPQTLHFDGSFYVQANHVYNFRTRAFTIAAWVKPGKANMSHRVVISKSYAKKPDALSPLYEWALVFDGDGRICFTLNIHWICAAYSLPHDQWTHVVGTYDSASAILFLDGIYVVHSFLSQPLPLPNGDTLMVVGGVYMDPANHANDFVGSIDDVRIYEAALGEQYTRYLAKCGNPDSHGNAISVYSESKAIISFSAAGIRSRDNVVLSPEPCVPGAEVTVNEMVLSRVNDVVTVVRLPEFLDIGENAQGILSLCAADTVDFKHIVRDLYFKFNLVTISSIMDVPSSTGKIILGENVSYPLKMELSGINLANGHMLLLSSSKSCASQETLLIENVDGSGTKGEVTLKAALKYPMLYVCWAPGDFGGEHRTPYIIESASILHLAVVDGSRRVTPWFIRNGFFTHNEIYLTPCGRYDHLADNFYMILTMGDFQDFFIPKWNETVCSVLTSQTTRTFTYSQYSPDSPLFHGWVHSVPPYHDIASALGGSPINYPPATPRQRLSIWGTSNVHGHFGGCCQARVKDIPAWGRAYSIELSPFDPKKVWFVWEQPAAIFEGGDVYFYIFFSNFRGEVQSGKQKFSVTIGSQDAVEVESNERGILEFMRKAPEFEEGDNVTITVALNGELNPENGKHFSRTIVMGAPIPKPGLALDPTKPILHMLRFGPPDLVIKLNHGGDPFKYDGLQEGERYIRPYDGMTSTAGFSFPGLSSTWRSVSADANGFFVVNAGNGTLHYFSLAVYATDTQRVNVEVDTEAEVQIYCGGKVVFFSKDDGREKYVPLSIGWNQFLIKAFAPYVNTLMKIRMMASGSGWNYSMPIGFPEDAVPLEEGKPISMALMAGSGDGFIYNSLNWDFYLSVGSLRPRIHTPFFSFSRWLPSEVALGKWLVDGTDAKPGIYAMRYLAFAIYAARVRSIVWTVQCHGPVEIWVDGAITFRCQDSDVSQKLMWSHVLHIGWHQFMVKASASYGEKWIFSMAPTGTGEMLAIAYEMGSTLPDGVSRLESNQVITEMLALKSYGLSGQVFSEIPRNVDDTPSKTDFNTSQSIRAYESVGVKIYGITPVDFFWIPEERTDGAFGSITDMIAGNSNQYYSFALYSTGAHGEFVVEHVGAFSMFVNGNFVSSAHDDWRHVIPYNLSSGWHQVVFKLTADDDFYWIKDSGNTTWRQAMANCQAANYSHLCNLDAFCPYNTKRRTLPNFTASTFAPLLPLDHTKEEDYVQIHDGGGDSTPVCRKWSDTHGGSDPPWSNDPTVIAMRRGYACCGQLDSPNIVVQYVYESGEVGVTTFRRYWLDPPVGKVEYPDSRTPLVVLWHPDEAVSISYRFDKVSTKWVNYTGSFTVNESVTVAFFGGKDGEYSVIQYLNVEVLATVVLYRTRCPERLTCALAVGGVESMSFMAFVSNKETNLQPYVEYDTALLIHPSAQTTGVTPVISRQYSYVHISDLEAGTYMGFYYSFDERTESLTSTLQIEPLTISPSHVSGHQNTTFVVQGLDQWDEVLFLEQWSNGSVSCDVSSCYMAMENYRFGVSDVTPQRTVTVNLHGFSGNVNCLCACVTGSSNKNFPVMPTCYSEFIAAVPVNITVVAPPTPTVDTVEFISPTEPRDGGDVVFGGMFSSNSSVDYNVLFRPNRTENAVRPPTCRVKSVNHTTLVCTASVSVGTIGVWSSDIYKDGKNITYDGALNFLIFVPPDVEVVSASGECALQSSSCVEGAVITFIGSNFDHFHTKRNVVKLTPIAEQASRDNSIRSHQRGALLAEKSVECVTVTVTSTSLTCQLENMDSVTVNSMYAVEIQLRLTKYHTRQYPVNGTLLLRGGNAPGWSGVIRPDPPKAKDPSESHVLTVITVVCVILVVAIIALVAAAVITRWRYKLVRKEDGEEEMSYMEEQLLRAERESTASLKRTVLNSQVPPLKENRQLKNSLNEL